MKTIYNQSDREDYLNSLSDIIDFNPPQDEDLVYLSKHLREIDKKEIHASNGMSPEEGLRYFSLGNDEVWIANIKGYPSFIFGLTRSDTHQGYKHGACVWALGTNEIYRYPKLLNQISRSIIDKWLQSYDALFNYVWEENQTHKRWIKQMGFNIIPSIFLLSRNKYKFIFFVKTSRYTRDNDLNQRHSLDLA